MALYFFPLVQLIHGMLIMIYKKLSRIQEVLSQCMGDLRFDLARLFKSCHIRLDVLDRRGSH
jgi:hypothetical protein